MLTTLLPFYSTFSQTNNTTYSAEGSGTPTGLTSSNTVLIGDFAGRNNMSGNNNTVVGAASGKDLTSGSNNIIFGYRAGNIVSSASYNICIGPLSGYDLNTSEHNIILGYFAGVNNTTGSSNIYLGSFSGQFTTTGGNNIFAGYASGHANTTGSNNIYIGRIAGSGSVTGTKNIAVGGLHSSNTNDTFSEDGNNQNVVLGVNTRIIVSGGASNAIAIGYGCIGGGSNTIVIGAESTVNGAYSAGIGNGITLSANNTLVLGGNSPLNRVSAGIGTVSPSQTASLELADTDKGLLLNRLNTSQRTGMNAGASEEALAMYDSDENSLYLWNGTAWNNIIDHSSVNLSLNNSTHELSVPQSNSNIDLAAYIDNTDAQDLTLSGAELRLSGDPTPVDLSGLTSNYTPDLHLTGTTLSLTGDNTNVDLNAYYDNTDAQQLTMSENVLSISGNNSLVDMNQFLDNTDHQNISLDGSADILSISGSSNAVDLSPYKDNTDRQRISSANLTGNELSITIENGNSITIDLEPILSSMHARIDSLVSVSGQVSNERNSQGNTPEAHPLGYFHKNSFTFFAGKAKVSMQLSSKAKTVLFRITNTSGKTLYSESIIKRGKLELETDLTDYTPGICFYTLMADGEMIDTKRIMLK
ncbi:MAG: hypothetical protein MI784_00215 [Cytophagales bacterium]|nr:hypothetical protein [Cytophagales bacterium]